jgi:uncharacterized membrane protein
MTLHSVLILLHLLGFAAFLGGAFAQQEFMKMSTKAGVAAAVRDEYERLAAAICTKAEVPGMFVQLVTGVVMVIQQPTFMKEHWLHGKLAAVALLLVLSHLEMFNARRLVKARAERGDAAKDEIDARKKKHAAMGLVGTVLVVALVLFVTVLRGVF